MDKLYAFTDMRQVQKLNQWNAMTVSGYEVGIRDYDQLDAQAEQLLTLLPYNLQIHTIRDLYPQLFDWLGLLDLNVWVIIGLMVVVACINMITALLILIIERSNMIGIFKALGAVNGQISSVFTYMAAYLILGGMLIGNAVGLALCWSQDLFGWFKLSQEAYYLSEVPIRLVWTDLIWINLGSFVVCYLVLLLPARFVSRITPVKAIRFQ
jgi:lipoprotein-releasing system permease protein